MKLLVANLMRPTCHVSVSSMGQTDVDSCRAGAWRRLVAPQAPMPRPRLWATCVSVISVRVPSMPCDPRRYERIARPVER